MRSADDFLDLLDRGVSAGRALSSLPQCELQYIAKVPIGVYLAARWLGWRFFPVRRTRPAMSSILIDRATNNLEQLKRWAGSRPQWALATGALSGVFALVVDGDRGRNSLLQLCGDDWDWLFTLRTQGGTRRYIFYTWPDGQYRIPTSMFLGEGLSLIGEGGRLLFPPSREANGAQHVFLTRATATQAPAWLLDSLSCSGEAGGQSLVPTAQCGYSNAKRPAI
jgi:Bifunctional DNA primase/polymerase, N-terminal